MLGYYGRRRLSNPYSQFKEKRRFQNKRSIVSKIFNIKDNQYMLLLGLSDSGLDQYLEELRKKEAVYIIKPTQLMNEMALSSLLGSAPGYLGSEEPTRFAKFVNENPNSTIVIKGTKAVDPDIFNNFIEQIINNELRENTQKIGHLDTSNIKLIIVHYNSFKELKDDDQIELLDRLANEEIWTHTGQKRPLFDLSILKDFFICHFFNFYDHPSELYRLERIKEIPDKTALESALNEFLLSNEELFKIYDKPVRVEFELDKIVLYVNEKSYLEKKAITEETFSRFLKELETYIGQEEARLVFKQAIASKIERESKRPYSIFCAGPPGVGKTEIAKRLGRAVGNFVRVDGNIITSVEKLFGSARERGLLFKGLSKSAASVILIDEVEKMSLDAILGLLQIIDEGRAVDLYKNETYDLSDSIIVFTSNVIRKESLSDLEARDLLKKYFPEEFIDRINDVVCFRNFSEEEKIKFAEFLAKRELKDYERERIKKLSSIRSIQIEVKKFGSVQKVLELEEKLSGRKLSEETIKKRLTKLSDKMTIPNKQRKIK